MRYLIIIALFLGSCACNRSTGGNAPKADTVYVDVIKHDTIPAPCSYNVDSLIRYNDSILVANNILGKRLLAAKLSLSHVDFYSDIVVRKPSQIIFFKGWLNRIPKPKLCKECTKKLEDPTK